MIKNTEEKIVKALKEIVGGKTYREVADKYGVSYTAVYLWGKKAGLSKPKLDWEKIKKQINPL